MRASACAILAALGVAGCMATGGPPEEFQAYLEDREAPRLVVQVCIPDRTAFFDELTVDVTDFPANMQYQDLVRMYKEARAERKYNNPYRSTSSVREYRPQLQWRSPKDGDFARARISILRAADIKGLRSHGGAIGGELTGSTERNQAVFFANLIDRPGDIIAVEVMVPMHPDGASERRAFWYKPPRRVPANGYSEWSLPVSEEDPNALGKQPIFWLLTHGGQMPIYPVRANAPRIRYALLSRNQYSKQEVEDRRSIDAVKLRYITQGISVDDPSFLLVKGRRERIPPC